MSANLIMEGVTRHAPTLMAHLNVPVAQDTHLQQIILDAVVWR